MTDNDTPALDSDAIVWSHPAGERAGRPMLVLLHGYGSDERDLFGLVPYLPPGLTIAALRAPLTPPWPAPGYSWYPIEGLDGRDPQRVTDAARRVLEWLDTLGTTDPVGLLGFSQGGAVSMQALRLTPDRFACAVNLSGYVARGGDTDDAALAAAKPPVFWGRGTHDDVIPRGLIDHTSQWLPDHAELTGRVYPGLTHSVSEDELVDVRDFVQKHLASA
ncbi:dienelactone hydrolase family protein [Microbacterium sediminicola]|uniref:Dienelactone hydrolase family protein n=1 Tax=Microbacterium sediminicola TaxID=415210 RepID=A0ABP4UMN0_9MICO